MSSEQKSAELGHEGEYSVTLRSGKVKKFKAKTIGRLKPADANDQEDDKAEKPGKKPPAP